jgi:hypothetical protein
MQVMIPVLMISSLIFYGCEVRSTNNITQKRYCGVEMSEREVVEVIRRGKGYEYSDKDMELHSEIAYFAQEIGGDSIIIEVFFILSNKNELGIYLSGPNNVAIIDKMICAILTRKYKNQIPTIKYILYYDETDENQLIAKIKSIN